MKKIRPQDMAKEQVEWYIKKENLKPHTKLPSEREFSEIWGFSRSALHEAIQQLIEEHVVYSKKGSGTYVAPPRLVRDIQSMQSTSQAMKHTGSLLWSEVLEAKLEACETEVARELQIQEGSLVFHLRRLRMRNNVPFMVENCFLNYEQCKGIEQHNFEEESLYKVLTSYGLCLDHGEEKIGIAYATKEIGKLLHVEEGQFLYHQIGTVKEERGKIIEYFKILARPDQMQYTSVLERKTEGDL